MGASSSLRARLILAATLWVVAGLVAAGLVLRLSFEDSLQRTFQLRLLSSLRALVAAAEVAPDGHIAVNRSLGDPRFDQPYAGWYWQISGSKGPPVRSRSLWDFDLPVEPPSADGQARFGTAIGPQGERLLTAERDLTFASNPEPVHVVVAATRRDLDAEIARFDTVLLLSFACLGAGLVVAVWFQAGFGLKPLSRLADDLAALRRTPGGRLNGPFPAEIAPLAEALNTVLDHDADLIERARTHVGNLAHGLKTPLAVVKAELDSGQADPAQIDAQVERISRMVEHHLTRARTEATLTRVAGSEVAVAPIAGDVARTLARVHPTITIRVEVDSTVTFPAESDDLAEMIGNLAENACKWAGSRVVIRARSGLVSIEDDGPGLSEAECQAVTRRGARLDEAIPGHGLGLSIVADLARLYGARLELGRSDLGGLRAEIRLDEGQHQGQ
ncbi:ATP-binding protein [Magnetospirillum moscoviense]|uniref:histidine kinase n=1 Tax=Magnetospirillum moscoviense TaxID=1437059 RepID=A0A178MIJ8_9PROT|nr:ATP-binding protein [Magnetospirillum moscoviense]OAN48541.1 hypothetical protein A6A05_15110 [Magnetospirillum moscoviense]